jgi:hypothetical protein
MSDIDAVVSQQSRFGEAQRLAEKGLFRCRGGCDRTLTSDAGVSVNHQGAVALAICFDCLGKSDVVICRGATGVEVKLRPRGVILVSTDLPEPPA